jgi:hypothetical protein
MLQRLCAVLNTANSQSVSNVAWGLTVLQHTHNWCMCGCLSLVRQMVMHFAVLPMLLPRHVQNVMHCMVQVRCALLRQLGALTVTAKYPIPAEQPQVMGKWVHDVV